MKKSLVAFVLAALLMPVSYPALASEKPQLFVSATCPHCAALEEWLNENGGIDKFGIELIDVYDNEAGSDAFQASLEEAGVPQEQWGVPALFYEGEIYMGDVPIEGFLAERTDGVDAPQGYSEESLSPAATAEKEVDLSVPEMPAAESETGTGAGMYAVVVGFAAAIIAVIWYVFKGKKESITNEKRK